MSEGEIISNSAILIIAGSETCRLSTSCALLRMSATLANINND